MITSITARAHRLLALVCLLAVAAWLSFLLIDGQPLSERPQLLGAMVGCGLVLLAIYLLSAGWERLLDEAVAGRSFLTRGGRSEAAIVIVGPVILLLAVGSLSEMTAVLIGAGALALVVLLLIGEAVGERRLCLRAAVTGLRPDAADD